MLVCFHLLFGRGIKNLGAMFEECYSLETHEIKTVHSILHFLTKIPNVFAFLFLQAKRCKFDRNDPEQMAKNVDFIAKFAFPGTFFFFLLVFFIVCKVWCKCENNALVYTWSHWAYEKLVSYFYLTVAKHFVNSQTRTHSHTVNFRSWWYLLPNCYNTLTEK